MKPSVPAQLLLLLLLSACDLADVLRDHHEPGRPRGDRLPRSIVRDGEQMDQILAGSDTVVYITGVEYPYAYDWRRDSLYGAVNCRLVVFAGQRRILEVPAGPGTVVGADADMHRMRLGHLYTDCPFGGETVICRDGKELFRYEGEEVIRGFQVREEAVYTLGQRRSGRGFSLRRDGEVLFESTSGTLLGGPEDASYPDGALYEDQGQLTFCYRIDGGVRTWYIFRGGRVEAVPLPTDAMNILDIKSIGGEASVLYVPVSHPGAVWVHTRSAAVELCRPAGASAILSGRLYADGYCKVSFLNRGGAPEEICFGRSVWLYNQGQSYREFYCAGDHVFGILADGDDLLGYCWDRRVFTLEPGRFLWAPCACVADGRFYLVVTPAERHLSPYLRVGDKQLAISINGYLTSVTVKY